MNSLSGLPVQLQFARRQIRAGRLAHVSTLQVSQGRVWVTQEGRADDFWLKEGESMVLLPGNLVVVEADRQSAIRIEPVLLQTVRGWLSLSRSGLCGLVKMLGGRGRHEGQYPASLLSGSGKGH